MAENEANGFRPFTLLYQKLKFTLYGRKQLLKYILENTLIIVELAKKLAMFKEKKIHLALIVIYFFYKFLLLGCK